jgi:dTDP-glucose 4,6-dehydratase
MLALDQHATGTFHFSVPSDQTVRDVVARVCDEMNAPFADAVKIVGERPGQDSRYWLDCTKARQELGWQPQVNENWDEIRNEPLEYVHKV